MALLIKVKASSLMETLVATVLIVIIFMVSSMVLNNIISTNIKNNTDSVETRLSRLEYEYRNNGFQLPYQEDFDSWDIFFSEDVSAKKEIVLIEATNIVLAKTITKSIVREN